MTNILHEDLRIFMTTLVNNFSWLPRLRGYQFFCACYG